MESKLTDEVRAYHEAGHTVWGIRSGFPIRSVTIEPRREGSRLIGGSTDARYEVYTKREIDAAKPEIAERMTRSVNATLALLLAGRVAARIKFPDMIDEEYEGDCQDIEYFKECIAKAFYDDDLEVEARMVQIEHGSPGAKNDFKRREEDIDRELTKIFKKQNLQEAVKLVAGRLMQKRTIDGDAYQEMELEVQDILSRTGAAEREVGDEMP